MSDAPLADACYQSSSIAAGASHLCVIGSGRRVTCTGDNSFGALGTGSAGAADFPPDPFLVPDDRVAVDLCTGSSHTCALLDDGAVWCAGDNSSGQLLRDTSASHTHTPAVATDLGAAAATALHCGNAVTCAVLSDGDVQCSNAADPLSFGTAVVSGAVFGSDASFAHCVILEGAAGVLACSGWAAGTATVRSDAWPDGYVKVVLPGSAPAKSVVMGEGFVCALTTGGGVACWGANDQGQVGDGTHTDRQAPPTALVTLPASAVSIAAGLYGMQVRRRVDGVCEP